MNSLILPSGLFAYWIWVYLYLVTSGTPTAYSDGFVYSNQTNSRYRQMWWYHLFGAIVTGALHKDML